MSNISWDRLERERLDRQSRLPPGQTLTNKFPVLHYGPVPKYDLTQWDFRVFGLVVEEKRWTWPEFNQLPRRKVTLDIHCVTRWSKLDTEWEGISVKDLVDQGIIQLRPEARFVIQHCEYGFTANLPLPVVLSDVFLLATHYDGRPLEPEHGYPLRGVIGAIPGRRSDNDRYFWKGGKWLRALEFTAQDQAGFWEQAGYSMSARIWEEERYR